MKGLDKEVEDIILSKKSKIDILFVVYKLQSVIDANSLYNILSDIDRSKFNINILLLCKSQYSIDFDAEINYLYETENCFWDSMLNNNLNLESFFYKQYDIVISYSGIITSELIYKLDSSVYKLAYMSGEFIDNHKGYTIDYLRNIYINIDRIICESEYEKLSIISNLGEDLIKNIKVIDKNTNINLDINKDDSVFTIVSVARLNYDKGIDKLIRVHRQLLNEGIKNRVIVIGEGSQRSYFEHLININKIKDTFILEGYKINPYDYIKNADLFVLASDSEGLPLVIMESMILQKPIVATNVNGTRELLQDGYGMLVENNDIGLYTGIKEMILNKELREVYINKLKSINQFSFDEEIVIPKVENLFDRYVKIGSDGKKNILIVIYVMAGGGCEKSLINLLNSLDYNKYSVDVIAIIKDMGDIYNFNPNVNVRYIFNNVQEFFENYTNEYIYPLDKVYDLEIAYSDISSIEFLLKNGSYNTKKIAWVHGDISYIGTYKPIEYIKSLYDKVDKIVCVSNDTKDRFIEFLDKSLEPKIEVIYNAMPVESILGKKRSKKTFNILAVSRLSYEKGIDRLIRIHKRLLDEGVYNYLSIIGDGYDSKNIENLINELGVSDTCKIYGYISNPYPYIKNSDLIVSPSREEGFGLVIAEAMILEKPIVATETHGSKDLLQYKYGLITLNDDEDLYVGIRNILKDDELRQSYINNIKTIDEFKFKKETVIKQIDNLINIKEGKIKVLFTILGLWGGGAEASLINILNNLDYSKYEVDLLILIKSYINFNDINDKVNKLPFIYNTEEEAYMDLIKDKPNLEINKYYDVEIAYLGRPTVEAITKCSKNKCKKISWIHGAISFTIADSSIEYINNLYSNIDKVVCVSDGVKKEFMDTVNEDIKGKCITINPIVDKDIIQAKSKLKESSDLIYTIPFYIDKNKDMDNTLKMATACMRSIEHSKYVNMIIYNQGGLTNEELYNFMNKFNINFTIIGEGKNDGIAYARYMMLKYILKEHKDIKYLAEIHLDMIFSDDWEVPIINRLENSDEPMMCANIVYYDTESNRHILNSDNRYVDFSGNLENKMSILKSYESNGIIEKFTHPVIHKISALEAINAYDVGFLVGKQGYEDDSVLLGYNYYMGTKNKWMPKCCLESCVYHKVCAQRFDINDKYEQWEINNNGLKAQYGAYGQKELARMREEYSFRFKEEYENMIIDKIKINEVPSVSYKKGM